MFKLQLHLLTPQRKSYRIHWCFGGNQWSRCFPFLATVVDSNCAALHFYPSSTAFWLLYSTSNCSQTKCCICIERSLFRKGPPPAPQLSYMKYQSWSFSDRLLGKAQNVKNCRVCSQVQYIEANSNVFTIHILYIEVQVSEVSLEHKSRALHPYIPPIYGPHWHHTGSTHLLVYPFILLQKISTCSYMKVVSITGNGSFHAYIRISYAYGDIFSMHRHIQHCTTKFIRFRNRTLLIKMQIGNVHTYYGYIHDTIVYPWSIDICWAGWKASVDLQA